MQLVEKLQFILLHAQVRRFVCDVLKMDVLKMGVMSDHCTYDCRTSTCCTISTNSPRGNHNLPKPSRF